MIGPAIAPTAALPRRIPKSLWLRTAMTMKTNPAAERVNGRMSGGAALLSVR